ncbi:MAG: Tm-1-like ATP-binding domain-containing protein, partial [Candidatus Promineifilaceae bacterium]
EAGHKALVIDVGVIGEPGLEPDIPASRVAEAAGVTLQALRERADRGEAIAAMTKGIAVVVDQLYKEGKIDGIIGMGGSAGTVIGTAGMRVLPVGIPKVQVSTLAGSDVGAYVGTKDVVMFPSIVDVAGVNRITSRIYANAVGAVIGMAETVLPEMVDKPLIAASMFGNTTKLVDRCREAFERHGYEVLVFHATGNGGKTMENLIEEGYFAGCLDVTPTEWADELAGGVLSAGPNRMEAAAKAGIPQVIAPGCLDMANFWARDTVPERYSNRKFYEWTSNVTLMRTTPEENADLGRILADKVNASSAPVAIFLPLRGVSMLDSPGGEFWWPEANAALFEAIKNHVKVEIPVYEIDANINDEAFADAAAAKLLEFLH